MVSNGDSQKGVFFRMFIHELHDCCENMFFGDKSKFDPKCVFWESSSHLFLEIPPTILKVFFWGDGSFLGETFSTKSTPQSV